MSEADLVERFELRLAQRREADGPADPADAADLARWGDSFALWPDQPAEFRRVWTGCYAAMHRLAGRLVAMVADALDMAPPPELLRDWTTRQWSNLVANHYPAARRDADARAGALPAAHRYRRPHPPVDRRPHGRTRGAGRRRRRVGADTGAAGRGAGPGGRLAATLERRAHPREPPPRGQSRRRERGPRPRDASRWSISIIPDMETVIGGEDGARLVAGDHVRRRQRLETPVIA